MPRGVYVALCAVADVLRCMLLGPGVLQQQGNHENERICDWSAALGSFEAMRRYNNAWTLLLEAFTKARQTSDQKALPKEYGNVVARVLLCELPRYTLIAESAKEIANAPEALQDWRNALHWHKHFCKGAGARQTIQQYAALYCHPTHVTGTSIVITEQMSLTSPQVLSASATTSAAAMEAIRAYNMQVTQTKYWADYQKREINKAIR